MNRDDAINLLREISKYWTDELQFRGCSIDGSCSDVEVKIILPADLFQSYIGLIRPVLEKRNFAVKKSNDFLTIYDLAKNNQLQPSKKADTAACESSKFYRKK